jgi:hypothetical protein
MWGIGCDIDQRTETTVKDKREAYRERQRARGIREVLMRLPAETIAQIDALQVRRGYDNRSAAALAVIEKGLKGFSEQDQAV